MTRIQVDAAAVQALGEVMAMVAEDLRWSAAHARSQAWSLGASSDSARALGSVLGDFEHQRQVLGRALADLGRATSGTGALYLETEGGLVDLLGGDGR